MKITSKGQVTIPQKLREKLGVFPNTEIEFVQVGDALKIVKSKKRRSRSKDLIRRMRGKADTKLTTEEIMKMTRP